MKQYNTSTMILKIEWIFLAYFFGSMGTCSALNIAVIGAGASGLASARNAIEQGHTVVIFEKMGILGGIWYYTDKIGKDKYGIEIHSPMYKYLRTNTPHQTMQFPGFPYPKTTQTYPSHEIVWKYLDSFANKFRLKKCIKYHHLVENVLSVKNGRWDISVRNLPRNRTDIYTYDAVFVCTNIFSSPRIPNIKGAEEYKGIIMHSRDFRKPDTFWGQDVLVIGGGASGIDILMQSFEIANRMTFSYHKKIPKESPLKKLAAIASDFCNKGFDKMEEAQTSVNSRSRPFTVKGDVKRFTGPNEVEFEDGSRQNFTVIVYATGYKYSYPFLDQNVCINTIDNYVEPLYKQILNVHHPSMAFIGIPYSSAHNWMVDLQARFALKFISRGKQIPSYENMMTDMQTQFKIRAKKGFPKSKPHLLGFDHKNYYDDLAQTADIPNIPEVYAYLYTDALRNLNSDPDYRNTKYTVIDDRAFSIE